MKSWIRRKQSPINEDKAVADVLEISSPTYHGNVPQSKYFHFWNELRDSRSTNSLQLQRDVGNASGYERDHEDTVDIPRQVPYASHRPINTSTIPKLSVINKNKIQQEQTLSSNRQIDEFLTSCSRAINIPDGSRDSYSTKMGGLVPQHVLVSSDHYFRLVHRSYEHLQAVHYRASQKFSIAEWLHIHALLLYGRIQAIQKAVGFTNPDHGCTAQLNQIDLSGESFVFGPIANALNAIGVVEDYETGILYIPDAIFPSQYSTNQNSVTREDSHRDSIVASDPVTELSSQEIKYILNGTLYDWQRSWYRVTESRRERVAEKSSSAMTRSSSELIKAIRDTTASLSKVRKEKKAVTMKNAECFDDNLSISNGCLQELEDYEKRLTMLIEEARNAKDYTISPPDSRSIKNRRLEKGLLALQPVERQLNTSPSVRTHTKENLAMDNDGNDGEYRDAEGPAIEKMEGPTNDDLQKKYEEQDTKISLTLNLNDSFVSSISSLKLSDDSPSQGSERSFCDADSSVESVAPMDQLSAKDLPNWNGDSLFGFDKDETMLRPVLEGERISEPTETGDENDINSDENDSENTIERIPSPVQYPAQPTTKVLPLPLDLDKNEAAVARAPVENETDKAFVRPQMRSALHKPSRIRNSRLFMPLSNSSSTILLDSSNVPQVQQSAKSSNGAAKPRVKIGNTSNEYSKSFVQYDSELWRDYTKFVDTLRAKNLADFSQLRQEYVGNYSWLLSVDSKSDEHCTKITMPRRSIAPQDQSLALILQMNPPSQFSRESWHIKLETDIDLSKLLTKYIRLSVNDNINDME